jgi:hypothetical protein
MPAGQIDGAAPLAALGGFFPSGDFCGECIAQRTQVFRGAFGKVPVSSAREQVA